jgi:four helix bundle protein
MQPNFATSEQLAWEATCPHAITTDLVWKLDSYRAALFLLHLARRDSGALNAGRPGDEVAHQLVKAAASVSANLAEGYSRSSRADRIRFLDYALGSCRECVSWYSATRTILPDDLIEQRLTLLTRIRSLLLGLIRSYRERKGSNFFER